MQRGDYGKNEGVFDRLRKVRELKDAAYNKLNEDKEEHERLKKQWQSLVIFVVKVDK